MPFGIPLAARLRAAWLAMRLFRWLPLRPRSQPSAPLPALAGGEEIPRYPPFLRGLPAAAAAQILATQHDLVVALQNALAFTDWRFAELVLPAVER